MEISQTLIYLLLSVHIILTSADDASAMAKLQSAVKPSGWDATDFCSWGGVRCDNAKRVTSVKLNSMGLTGTLPSALAELTHLQALSLEDNSFTGSIPSLANITSLEQIYLDSNNFTSFPDGFFEGLTSLQTFSISENLNLAPWTIPSELTQLTSLETFSASSAGITGQIPDIFEALSLKNLRISYNNLTGALPKSFSGSGILNFWANNQAIGLSGAIDVISNMTQISQVWLQNNLFTGPIPDLANCASLFDLQLRDNQFTGVIPSSLTTLSSLANISLANNKLQGPTPLFDKSVLVNIGNNTNSFCTSDGSACDPRVTALLGVAGSLGYPMALAESWKGNEPCNDWQFVTCEAQGINITTVNFGKQGFSGIISPSFANLTSLKVLYLNDNNLTGSIPVSLTTLPQLKLLDVSNNNLSGIIPSFAASVRLTTTGNVLIGKDTGAGGTSGKTPSSGSKSGSQSVTSSPSSAVSPGVIVGVVLGILLFAGIVLFFCYIFYSKRWRQKFSKVENHQHILKNVANANVGATTSEILSQSSGDHSEIPAFDNGNITISIQVLRQVTNNFSEDNILGKGGFGTVYKGELHDGTKIAVKRMESVAMGSKGMKEFEAEIAFLTKVRHRHLVALLGFCNNEGEKLLVFEYMPMGTLGEHLFEWRENGLPSLTWLQRVTIALDVARGVEYLHSLAQQSFIHRDLKPNNILLGDDMRAKVADFGLVKNAPDGKYSVETRLAGTFGYLAPEYAATGRVTTKVDVYAFGVVLMELITGRKALDETMPDERCHLVTWFRRVLINADSNFSKTIDQTLEPDDETYESIRKVAELAGHCTAREPHQRPDMGHAVNVIGPLVQIWRPASREEEEGNGIDLDLSLPQALQKWRADEGSSSMFNDSSCVRDGFADTFDSMDCR